MDEKYSQGHRVDDILGWDPSLRGEKVFYSLKKNPGPKLHLSKSSSDAARSAELLQYIVFF